MKYFLGGRITDWDVLPGLVIQTAHGKRIVATLSDSDITLTGVSDIWVPVGSLVLVSVMYRKWLSEDEGRGWKFEIQAILDRSTVWPNPSYSAKF